MTAIAILDLKQRVSKLSEADRRMLAAYMLRLKHESPAGRHRAARVMREMDEGKKVPLRKLAKELDHA
jgi:cytochrome c553